MYEKIYFTKDLLCSHFNGLLKLNPIKPNIRTIQVRDKQESSKTNCIVHILRRDCAQVVS